MLNTNRDNAGTWRTAAQEGSEPRSLYVDQSKKETKLVLASRVRDKVSSLTGAAGVAEDALERPPSE